MDVISIRNAEDALILGTTIINENGVLRDSRNGPVKVMAVPVTTLYSHPRERVIFLPERDANPYFHFMESLWMMAGRNDVEWISKFNSKIANYSDDGVTFHGAYGFRWRHAETLEPTVTGDYEIHNMDQLKTIANMLKENPDDRRVVLQMWNADMDLGKGGKDFPCNLIITFRINPEGHLDMTVFNRSNDMIWGAYGANAVHMSFMQEVMAAWIGVPIGQYWQISTNLHAYLDTLEKAKDVVNYELGVTPYAMGAVEPYPIVNTPIETWFAELDMFMGEGSVIGYTDPFFKRVAVPMLNSWSAWKAKNKTGALEYANSIIASDWKKACVEWLERR
jgi:thymidylate synthase